ncbi:MAG: GntR family transcriptional regulator [Acidobacteriaceae bacterium]|nr:GntR family transcriptional regulator [Acidobacteriaceae bacterium]
MTEAAKICNLKHQIGASLAKTSPAIIPLERESVADRVFGILRESILNQTFLPGQRLNPGELATKLSVSITPVKDAINRLAVEGLIEVRPRSGTFVSAVSLKEVTETFELRAALECLAAEKLIGHLSKALVERLRALTKELEKPVNTARERALHEQKNAELHRLIVHSAGNGKLSEMYDKLNAHITIARIHSSRRDWADRLTQETADHHAILMAIETGQKRKLVKVLKRHIERAAKNLVADLKKSSNAAGERG